jgi:tryptophan-rich sensory protein
VSLVIFGALTALAALSGVYFEPGPWYQGLIKPDWTPANWVFPLVWSVLYVAIAVAGWLVWCRTRPISVSLVLWFVQLVLDAAWPWLFFGLHLPLLAFVDLVLLFLAVVAFSLASFNAARAASLLFLPYALWLGFAGVLNYWIWRLNLGLM